MKYKSSIKNKEKMESDELTSLLTLRRMKGFMMSLAWEIRSLSKGLCSSWDFWYTKYTTFKTSTLYFCILGWFGETNHPINWTCQRWASSQSCCLVWNCVLASQSWARKPSPLAISFKSLYNTYHWEHFGELSGGAGEQGGHNEVE